MNAGRALFVLGIVLGLAVSPWFFLVCLVPILVTVFAVFA